MAEVYIRPFPLYDHLQAKLSTRTKTVTRETLSVALNQLDLEAAEQVALLLIHYYFLNNPTFNIFTPENCERLRSSQNRKSTLPFGIKISPGGRGISVDMNMIPDHLVMILAEFCSL